MLDRIRSVGKFCVARAKAVAAGAVALVAAGSAATSEAAVDTVAVQAAVDANLAQYESIGAIILIFVLAVAVLGGLIAFARKGK